MIPGHGCTCCFHLLAQSPLLIGCTLRTISSRVLPDPVDHHMIMIKVMYYYLGNSLYILDIILKPHNNLMK